MRKNLLNPVRNILIKTKVRDMNAGTLGDKEMNSDKEFINYLEKCLDSLTEKLDGELLENCCMECASKIVPRFFPDVNDMTRRMLVKIYAIKGSDPGGCIGPLGNPHGWVYGEYKSESEMNRIIKERGNQKNPDIFDGGMVGSHSDLGNILFPVKNALWKEPDSTLFSIHSAVYCSFLRQIILSQLLQDVKFAKIRYILSNELSQDQKSIAYSDGLSRLKSMRVRFSWVSFKIIDIMLQVKQFSKIQKILERGSDEQPRALQYIFSEYLKEMGSIISKRGEEKTGSFDFVDYLSKTQGELREKYNLKDIVSLDSWYASSDEIVQFIKYKSGDVYMCDGHEATMGLYKILFNKLDNRSGDRGEAFENVVLEFFRSYLNPDCADSFYIKKKDNNETDVVAWGSAERVVILGECKMNQRYSSLKVSAERSVGSGGYITKSVAQLIKRKELIENGEELKPVISGNYGIPNDIKEYDIISLSIHASEYIAPMCRDGVHIVSLESLVMILRSIDGIKDFQKYMSFRKECIHKNRGMEFDEFDVLYAFCKGVADPENLQSYQCHSVLMPFDISDNGWRRFIKGEGKYKNLVWQI